VLLVTKAVGDSFNGHGIADTMIKFNGFPFLEKEDKASGDHAFIEPSELYTRKRWGYVVV
jgi:chloride channel 3/4/5